MLILGIIIAALVSRLRLTLYNEAKYIGWAMYNFGFVVIFVAIIFLVPDVVVRFALLSCCVIFITAVSLSVLFIPKLRLLFKYTEDELRQMNEEQLQAVIRSYTKKFSSSNDRKNSTIKGTAIAIDAASSYQASEPPGAGSSFEEDVTTLANSIRAMTNQINELKSENKTMRETSDDYRALYEKFYHENMTLKNEVFELRGLLRKYEEPHLSNNKE